MDHQQSRRVEINPRKKKRCRGLVDAKKANQATIQYSIHRASIIQKKLKRRTLGVGYKKIFTIELEII
jgi:hypothetical protein